ncbi:hypothetical protein GYMLUDRAFT_917680 [Collybiopsis luxurians FD-317 M1]|uniref:DUF7729 domain-containing protein n=1 Tax=Collybiopsis luxurians FD-317 M1 TaxID=944289 RepID=A0A0D0C8A1_9AGAR|nr:hypothetical protein GYMLUDRAFT_917680 [Collybiopsis luxurians FD-317 M1]
MFTPPGSPLPSPRAKLDQPNPLEEMQRQATDALLAPPSSSSSTSSPTTSAFSPSHSSSSLNSDLALKPIPSSTETRPSSSTSASLSSSSRVSRSSAPSSFSPSSTPSASILPSPPLSSASSSSESPYSNEKLFFPQQQALLARQKDLEDQLHRFQSRSETKRRIGRNLKWTAITVPFVLVLVTLGNHCLVSLLGMAGWMNGVDGPRMAVESEEGSGWLGNDLNISVDGAHPSESMSYPHHHHGHHVEVLAEDRATLYRRASATSISISVASATGTPTDSQLATSTTPSASTTTTPATQQDLPTIPSDPVLPTPFPQPSYTQNFSTQSCFDFFQNMTNSVDFRSCRPFGILQSASSDFGELQDNLTALNAVIWGTCNTTPGVDQCTSTMASYAASLRSSCSKDLSNKNANAVSTLSALQAYSLTYSAGCLTDPTTNSYCYVKAAHNSNPSDLFFYNLPSGISISNTSTLTCSSCTKSLMSLYVNALNANASQYEPLAQVYGSAQALASSACGPTYASVSTSSQADTSGALSYRGDAGAWGLGWRLFGMLGVLGALVCLI